MNLREKLFVEVRKGTKVTLSESDLNKMDRMYERELAQYDNQQGYDAVPKRAKAGVFGTAARLRF